MYIGNRTKHKGYSSEAQKHSHISASVAERQDQNLGT